MRKIYALVLEQIEHLYCRKFSWIREFILSLIVAYKGQEIKIMINIKQTYLHVYIYMYTLIISFFIMTNILQTASSDTSCLIEVIICELLYEMLRSNDHVKKAIIRISM